MNIILALIVISQILILPNLSFRWGKEASAQLLIILTLCSLIWQKNRALALFIGWSVILFVIQKAYIINDAGTSTTYKVNLLSFFTMLNIVLYGIFYYVLHQIKFNKETIYNTFCLVAIIHAGYVLIQVANLDQFFFHLSGVYGDKIKYSWPVGLWGNETLCSWCIALCSPYMLAFNKLRYKVGYGICGVALFFTGGRIALAMYLLSFLIYLFFTKRKWLFTTLLVIFVASGIIGYRAGIIEKADPHRIEVWKHTIELWKSKTITGYGHGAFRGIIQRTLPPNIQSDGHWAQAHNEYVQILFEQGLIGLGIFLSLMLITFYRFWRTRKGLIPIMSLFVLAGIMTYGFPLRCAQGVIPLVSLVLFEKSLKEI